jgi:hypothetical protein
VRRPGGPPRPVRAIGLPQRDRHVASTQRPGEGGPPAARRNRPRSCSVGAQPAVQSNSSGTPPRHPTAAVRPQCGQVSQVIRSLAMSLPAGMRSPAKGWPATLGSSQADPAERNRSTRSQRAGTRTPTPEWQGTSSSPSCTCPGPGRRPLATILPADPTPPHYWPYGVDGLRRRQRTGSSQRTPSGTVSSSTESATARRSPLRSPRGASHR